MVKYDSNKVGAVMDEYNDYFPEYDINSDIYTIDGIPLSCEGCIMVNSCTGCQLNRNEGNYEKKKN